MIEHKAGEIFSFERRVLKVVEQDGCDGCYFNSCNGEVCERPRDGVFEYCFKSFRNDKKNVVFMTLDNPRLWNKKQ